MFIGQCLNANNTHLLYWLEIINPNTKANKKQPTWHLELELKILHNNSVSTNRKIPNSSPTENMFYRYIEATMQRTSKLKWTATQTDNNIIIGKKKKQIHEHRIAIKHYKRIFNMSPLEQCKGCQLNQYNIPDTCIFEQDTNKIIEIPVTLSSKSTSNNLPIMGLWHRVRMSPSSIQAYFDFKKIAINQNTQRSQPKIALDQQLKE